MINGYLTIGIIMTISSLLSGWMFIASKAHHVFKAFLATVSLSLAVVGWLVLNSILGLPSSAMPNKLSAIVAVVPDKEHNAIYVWLRELPVPRAYVFPYSDKLMQALDEARGKAKGSGGVARLGPGHPSDPGLGHNNDPLWIDVVSPLPPKE